MARRSDALFWRAYGPADLTAEAASGGDTVPGWLEEVWSLRGYVLYDDGARPWFKIGQGRYADRDAGDVVSHHLLAYRDGQLVGCVRLLPLTAGVTGVTERFLGADALARMLRDLGAGVAEALEGGRWMAHPDHRHHGLGMLLVAAGVALARHLGYRVLLCSVGTKAKQNRVLARLGWRPVPAVEPFYAETFADTLQVMYIDPSRPAPGLAVMMDEVASDLNLDCAGRVGMRPYISIF